MLCGAKLLVKTRYAGIGGRDKTFEVDQMERALGFFTGGKNNTVEVRRRQALEQSRTACVGHRLGHEQGAVGAGLLLHAATDGESISVIAACVATNAEWEATDNPRGVIVLRSEIGPPGIRLGFL